MFQIFAQIIDKVVSQLKIKYSDVIDCQKFLTDNFLKKIPTNRVVYFRNLKVCFERVKEIEYRGKKQYQILTKIIDGEVLLEK